MRFRFIAALVAGVMAGIGNVASAFPFATSTGLLDVATASTANWDSFDWDWNNRDYQQISVTFTNASGFVGGDWCLVSLVLPRAGFKFSDGAGWHGRGQWEHHDLHDGFCARPNEYPANPQLFR